MPNYTVRRYEDDGAWCLTTWEDGTEQWAHVNGTQLLFVERIIGPKSRRKSWCIVDRSALGGGTYPPVVAQIEDLDTAKATLRMLLAMGEQS